MRHIDVEHVGIRYAGQQWQPYDVSFRVTAGTVHLLTGPSGSGKSSLMRMIAGLIPEHVSADCAGRVVFFDDVTNETRPLNFGDVAYVGQDPDSQVTCRRVVDEVAATLEFHQVPAHEIDDRVSHALHLVGLHDVANHTPWNLSGGQRQRLAIACALARNASVLLLDEPTANLDVAGRTKLHDLIRSLRSQERIILMVDHNLHDVVDWVDTVSIITEDGVIATDTVIQETLSRAKIPAISQNTRSHSPQPQSAGIGLALKNIAVRHRLQNITFDLQKGKITALIGRNGAGKTSIMCLLAGQCKYNVGQLLEDGNKVHRVSDGAVAWSSQNPEHQFSRLTVREELAIGLAHMDPQGVLTTADIEKLRDDLGLARLGEKSPYMLSGGQKRLLGLWLAIAANRKYLLLDEPTAHLDEAGISIITSIIQKISAAGGTILLVSHDLALITSLANHVVALKDGEILWDGLVEDFINNNDVKVQTGLLPGVDETTKSPASSTTNERNQTPRYNPLVPPIYALSAITIALITSSPGVLGAMLLICLASLVYFDSSLRNVAMKTEAIAIIGIVFGLLGGRGTLYNGGTADLFTHALQHGLLMATICAASVAAFTATRIEDSLDSLSQNFPIPYTWCTVALTGSSISTYIAYDLPAVASAARLRSVYPGRTLHNFWVRLTLPIRYALPLYISAIRYGGRLSETLISRGFGLYPQRTYRTLFPWRLGDTIASVIAVIIALALTVAIH